MRKIFVCSSTLIVLFTLSITVAAQSIVQGSVFARDDAVIPGFLIQASSYKRIVETTSDSDGRYFLSLPAGVYVLSTRQAESGYWHPLRRSNLLVEADSSYEVDLWPSRRVLATYLVVTKRGVSEPNTLSPTPQYKEYGFPENTQIRLILQFSTSKRRRSKFQDVILTYDRYTIHAETAEVAHQTREIILKGAVRFYGSTKMIRSDKATVFLERKRPVLSIEGTSEPLAPGDKDNFH